MKGTILDINFINKRKKSIISKKDLFIKIIKS